MKRSTKPGTLYRYSVTFENDTTAPDTAKGELAVPNPSLGVRRAFEAAKRQYPGRQWSSVVVLLERT